ncbi:MAG: SGNH/GDSL hydrolase family protein [Rhodospirillales bacterium]|nr:SGNH/GDSL hydrolase family protein [Rhodospirillales bacterium]
MVWLVLFMSGIRVCFFGDSICVGQHISIERTWVARTSYDLARLGEELGVSIVSENRSINGNTTRQALERMPFDVQSQGYTFLLVQFGLNDCNFWETDGGLPRVSSRAFEANLAEIISRGLQFGAKKIFLNTNHPTGRSGPMVSTSPKTFQEMNEAYNEIIREVAGANSEFVTLIDIEAACRKAIARAEIGANDIVLEDLLHLSDVGHEHYHRLVSPVLQGEFKTYVENSRE